MRNEKPWNNISSLLDNKKCNNELHLPHHQREGGGGGLMFVHWLYVCRSTQVLIELWRGHSVNVLEAKMSNLEGQPNTVMVVVVAMMMVSWCIVVLPYSVQNNGNVINTNSFNNAMQNVLLNRHTQKFPPKNHWILKQRICLKVESKQ